MPDWRRLLESMQRKLGARPDAGKAEDGLPEDAIRKGYEPTDVNLRVIGIVAGVIIVLAILIHLALLLLLERLAAQEGERLPVPEASPASRFPPPKLQVSPSEDLARLRAGEEWRLQGYGWVDRSQGIVHIPIERAMDLIVERGLPGRPAHAP